MRGFPPIQIFLLCLAFIVLAVPLSQLTGTSTQDKSAVKAAVKAEKSGGARLRVRYAHRPATLSVKIADKELVAGEMAASPLEMQATLLSAEEGVDVFVAATWPEGTPDTALTLEIEPDGLESRTETRWSSGAALDEVITFAWSKSR
ncbi:MAG TPA: hypothetical protein VGE39_19000 [Prosthecobacter sp.]